MSGDTTEAMAEVFVDGHTGLFHCGLATAGPDAAAFSRAQAELMGYRPCPDCFWTTDDAGGVEARLRAEGRRQT